MSEAGFASLGPTLLARKGGAKPAMRPQLAPLPEIVAAEQLEDLGWNDMGHDDAADAADIPVEAADSAKDYADDGEAHANVLPLNPANTNAVPDADPAEAAPLLKSKGTKAPASVPAPTPTKRRPAKKSKAQAKTVKASSAERRAAFTLRLDTERHLKLRLAATMQGVSAQALVTEALDAMLDQFEELDALASRMRRH